MAEYVWEEADKTNPWGRKRAKGTHCSQGHEFTEENTFVRPYDKTRVCRECRRRYARKKYQENKHAGKTKGSKQDVMKMATMPETVFLAEDAGKLFADLQKKLETTEVPCRSMMKVFDNPEVVDKKTAAMLCSGCPLIKECGAFAVASNQEYGIWGGVNYTKRRYENGSEWFDVKESGD